LGANRDRRADKCCKQEATFESLRRHCDGFIFKGDSQGGAGLTNRQNLVKS
jgi:hypothetical protein